MAVLFFFYDRFRFHQKIPECELEWILLESIEYSA